MRPESRVTIDAVFLSRRTFLMIATTVISAFGQQAAKEFLWVNPLPMGVSYPGVSHHTFISPSMRHEVGYCIYLPPRYDDATNSAQRYPVVYYLDGSRPGSEIRSISLAETIHAAISDGTVPAAIYVWVNGGEVSHYNYPSKNSMGEDVFVKELIPHVDRTYRTIAERRGRAIEGFSQGGRGTTRIMFKYPHLFVSAAPGGGGPCDGAAHLGKQWPRERRFEVCARLQHVRLG